MGERVPEIAARIIARGGGSAPPAELGQAIAWSFDELVPRTMRALRASGEGSGGTLQFSAVAWESLPGLGLSPDEVLELARAGVGLDVVFTDAGGRGFDDYPDIDVVYKVTGHFSPDDFTKRAGLAPTHTGREGDPLGLVRAKLSQWRIETGRRRRLDFSVPLATILSMLAPHAARLRSAPAGLDVRVNVAFEGLCSERIPRLTVTVAPAQIQAINQLGAGIEVDLIRGGAEPSADEREAS